jgi:tetratricopeptide (TPR) repeat protein
MFQDDFWDDDLDAMDELLHKYEQLKQGNSMGMMDEEDFERLITYFMYSSAEEEALRACDIARTYYPFSVAVLFYKAELLAQAQKYGQAMKVLDEIEQYEISNIDAVLLRADILMSQLKYDQAAALLEARVQEFEQPEKIEILLELSDVYDACEELDAVFDALKRVIDLDPQHEEALQKICFWANLTNRQAESIDIHTAITEEYPYNALAWFNLGAAFQGLKQYEKAIDAYEFCVAIDDKFEFAYRNMADACMRLKWYEKALDLLEKHLEIAKAEDAILEAMGYCWEKQKNYPRARYYYRQASQLSPQDDNIFFKIGETYAREQQWEKAVKAYSAALRLNKENASYCLAIGNCLMEMGITNEALVCLVNAVRLKPNNKTMWMALIRGLLWAGYHQEALVQIGMAEEYCGNKPEFDYYRAAALIDSGKSKEGLIMLENALHENAAKVKVFTEINADFLRRQSVADLIGRYKKR